MYPFSMIPPVTHDYDLAVTITQNRHADGLTSRTPGTPNPREEFLFAHVGYVLD